MDDLGSYLQVVGDDGALVPLTLVCKKFMDGDILVRNVKNNLKRTHLRLAERPDILTCKHEPLAIVAGGPSLRQTVTRLADFKNVLVCGSAHDFVSRAGINLKYAVISDGIPTMVDYLQAPQTGCTYLVASQCDPNLFEHLEAAQAPIQIWHYRGQVCEVAEEAAMFGDDRCICWGSSCTINAIQIALLLGYQDLHFFGFDCAHAADAHHAYEVPDFTPTTSSVPEVALIGDDSTAIVTDKGLIMQAVQFMQMIESEDGLYFNTTIHGGGLIHEMVRQGNDELRKRVSLEA
jgi:hypothetical protein